MGNCCGVHRCRPGRFGGLGRLCRLCRVCPDAAAVVCWICWLRQPCCQHCRGHVIGGGCRPSTRCWLHCRPERRCLAVWRACSCAVSAFLWSDWGRCWQRRNQVLQHSCPAAWGTHPPVSHRTPDIPWPVLAAISIRSRQARTLYVQVKSSVTVPWGTTSH